MIPFTQTFKAHRYVFQTLYHYLVSIICVGLSGDSDVEFMKLDLADPWLHKALGVDRKHIRMLGPTNVVNRIREAIKLRRGEADSLCP
jgi:hypothetical protein